MMRALVEMKNPLKIISAVLTTMAVTTSCSDERGVTWEAHVKSPDGHYQVNAETIQQGGPGNAALYTEVKLSQGDNESSSSILVVSHDEAPEAVKNAVSITWIGSNKVRLEYITPGHVDFLASTAAGVDVEARPIMK